MGLPLCPRLGPCWEPTCPLLLLTVYIAVGIIFYVSVESEWSAIDALYFAVVTMSTVGFGDFSPTMSSSRLFTIFYIFIGIIVVFSQLSAAVMQIFGPIFNWTRRTVEMVLPEPAAIDVNGNGKADFVMPPQPTVYYAKNLAGPTVLILGLQLLFALIFMTTEDWSYGIAVYYCLVTATTVGYGDFSPSTDGGHICASIHIMLSVILLGALIGDIDVLRTKRSALLLRAEHLTRTFDRAAIEEMLSKLDADGGGVTKWEFVVGMLLQAGLVEQGDVDPYVALFEKADKSGDGRLGREDIGEAFDQWEKHAKGALDGVSTMISRPKRKTSTASVAPAPTAAPSTRYLPMDHDTT